MSGVIVVRPIAANEWSTYRALRLRALLDAPDAFGSTHAAESTRPDAMWQERLLAAERSADDCALFAESAGQICGLLWCKRSEVEPHIAHAYQMWVDPAARGMGVGDALLRAGIDWARQMDVRYLRLGVTILQPPSPAMRLYRRHGFVPVDSLEPLREGSPLMAQSMELRIV